MVMKLRIMSGFGQTQGFTACPNERRRLKQPMTMPKISSEACSSLGRDRVWDLQCHENTTPDL